MGLQALEDLLEHDCQALRAAGSLPLSANHGCAHPQGGLLKILLVDDHALVRRGLVQLLATCVEGADVTQAGSADEAVEILSREPHDVALVDIRMPGRDGLDLLREIRSSWPSLPVIMLSSHDNGEYFKAALGEAAAGYLLKDATPEDLAQAIRSALPGDGNALSPHAAVD